MTFNPSPHPVTCPCSWCVGSVELKALPPGTPVVEELDRRTVPLAAGGIVTGPVRWTGAGCVIEPARSHEVPSIAAGTPVVAAEMTPLPASVAELDLLRAELASARQEIAQLRARLPKPDNQNGGPA